MRNIVPGVGMRKVGRVQASMLMALREHGDHWHAGSGWTWNGDPGTTKICETLVKRSLVQRFSRSRVAQNGIPYGTMLVYELTNEGKRVADELKKTGMRRGAVLKA